MPYKCLTDDYILSLKFITMCVCCKMFHITWFKFKTL